MNIQVTLFSSYHLGVVLSPDLKAICHRQGGLELAVVACQAMGGLYNQFQEMRLWWKPRHVGLDESNVVDMATKHAAQGIDLGAISEDLPQRLTTLNSVIHRHYATRFDAQWDLSFNRKTAF